MKGLYLLGEEMDMVSQVMVYKKQRYLIKQSFIYLNYLNDCQTYPKEVIAFKNISILSVVCGEGHTLALTRNNELFSWGLNQSGQLGI